MYTTHGFMASDDYEDHRRLYDMDIGADGWPDPIEDAPGEYELREMILDSVVSATDGCRVEPDGICEHGHPSWLLRMGLI